MTAVSKPYTVYLNYHTVRLLDTEFDTVTSFVAWALKSFRIPGALHEYNILETYKHRRWAVARQLPANEPFNRIHEITVQRKDDGLSFQFYVKRQTDPCCCCIS